MRSRLSLRHAILVLGVVAAAASAADEPASTLTFDSPLSWYFESDIGLLHVYADETLHTVDLVQGGAEPRPGLRLPGAERPGSVAHLKATEVALVFRADAGVLREAPGETSGAKGTTASYGVNVLTGEILWEGPELPRPVETLVSVGRGLAVLRHGIGWKTTLLALEYRTGRVVWTKEVAGTIAWIAGPIVVAVGERATVLDLATGAVLADEALRKGKGVAVAPTSDGRRFVVLSGKHLDGYDVGESAGSAHVRRAWSAETSVSMSRPCLVGRVCGIDTYPGNVALVRGKKTAEAVDVATGRVLWRRGSGKGAVSLSPGGTHVVEFEKRGLHVHDLGSLAAPYAARRALPADKARKWSAHPSAVWTGEEEFLVFEGPDRISRFVAHESEPLWSTELPERAKYRMTSREKGSMVGRIFAAVLLTAVSAANPITVGSSGFYSYNYYYVFIPNLNVRQDPRFQGAGSSRADVAEEGDLPEPAREALRRYRSLQERTLDECARSVFLVTGPLDDYRVQWLDPESGNLEGAAGYRGTRVHGIEPFPIHRLALVQEENRRVLRLLALKPTPF